VELCDIRDGDRIRVANDAPVSLARTSDRLGTVVATRGDYARPLTAWVDSQACEFDFDPTELTLVARAVYMNPGEIRTCLQTLAEVAHGRITQDTRLRIAAMRDRFTEALGEPND
jgi:hypothetical protein